MGDTGFLQSSESKIVITDTQKENNLMRYTIKKWFLFVILVWCITGLPVIVAGISMVGTDYSLAEWVYIFVPPSEGILSFITWLISMIIVFFPLMILPFAVVKQKQDH